MYLFASMGVPTGQDFDRLIALRAKVAGWLEGEELHGTIWRAGLPKTMLAAERGALTASADDEPRRRSPLRCRLPACASSSSRTW